MLAWTCRELFLIKKYYPIEGSKVKSRIPTRTIKAIRSKARSMGLSFAE